MGQGQGQSQRHGLIQRSAAQHQLQHAPARQQMQLQQQAPFQLAQIRGRGGQDVSMLDSSCCVMSDISMQQGNNQFVPRQGEWWQLQ